MSHKQYLQGEDARVGGRVQLDDCLHGKRAVDEVGRLVVHVLDPDDDALVVRVWMEYCRIQFMKKLRENKKCNLHCSPRHSADAEEIGDEREAREEDKLARYSITRTKHPRGVRNVFPK